MKPEKSAKKWAMKINLILLTVFFCIASLMSLNRIILLQGNARVVNYTGIVRGATQRLVKQEMYGYPNDSLINYLDGIIDELLTGEGANELIYLPDNNYQSIMKSMKTTWLTMKEEILNVRNGVGIHGLFELSEVYFDMADSAVSEAERYSEECVGTTVKALIFLNASFVIVVILLWIFQHKQRQVEMALDSAQNASRAKSEFLSRMSHEIRTPMNGIIGMTAIAQMSLKNENRLVDCLKKIDISSNHLLALLNDVLDMSRIENGKIKINPSEFSLRALLENVTGMYYLQAKDMNIEYETVLMGEIPDKIYGDSLRINQIISNLISNALKFTPEGGLIRMKVSIIHENEGVPMLRLAVSDTGCGIAEKNFTKIFEAFEQESSYVTQNYGGTGLGLSIVKRFTELMGGKISVESKLGIGSIFTVDIPLTACNDEEAQRISYDGKRAIIIGGDSEARSFLNDRLELMGMNTKPVQFGRDALDIISEAHNEGRDFDFCFVNLTNEDMDGLETSRCIRGIEGCEGIRIFLLAYDISDLEQKAKNAGADGVILKPLFRSNIEEALQNIKHRNGTIEACEMNIYGERTENTQPNNNEDMSAQKEYNLEGIKILIVEDNEINMEIASELMMAAGATIARAENGERAVEEFKVSPEGYFDVILMDIQMPVMDGYEATRRIRSMARGDASTVKILAMSANAFVEDVEKSRRAGMDAHISKPMDIDIIFDQIRSVL